MSKNNSGEKQVPIESHLALLTFVASTIPSVLLIFCLWLFNVSIYVVGIVAVFLIFLILYCVSSVWRKAQYQFRSLHSLLDAIVSGDYSFRGMARQGSGAFGDLINTINSLANTLQRQRFKSEESQLLLRKVVDQIDVAIIAWDQDNKIRLINPAASKLLRISEQEIIGSKAVVAELDLPQSLTFTNSMEAGETKVKTLAFDNNRGRFRLHMERFIAEGDTHNLLFLTNVSNILRIEEKKAWRNLVRVLSHEINNSLSPLKSLSDTLMKQVQKREQDPELAKELIDGMSIVGNRAESVANFVQSYHKIARLPEPQKKPTELKQAVAGLIKLFPDETIHIEGEAIELQLDPSQFEQVLINIIKNAVEANESYEAKHDKAKQPIDISWALDSNKLVLHISDAGEGIQNPENLFTPFYTTKSKGSGIGLVFSQQVIEAHDGFLTIKNREDQHGCVVTIELPQSLD